MFLLSLSSFPLPSRPSPRPGHTITTPLLHRWRRTAGVASGIAARSPARRVGARKSSPTADNTGKGSDSSNSDNIDNSSDGL